MINREEWLLMRKTYLGGSDLGAVIGVNKYKTALDVYLLTLRKRIIFS